MTIEELKKLGGKEDCLNRWHRFSPDGKCLDCLLAGGHEPFDMKAASTKLRDDIEGFLGDETK